MVDIYGNEWPQMWVEIYNGLTARIDTTTHAGTKENLLNERHRFYTLCVAVLSEGLTNEK